MATPLTAAHRSWRVRVFIATWLAYVGFYFCRKPWSIAKSSMQREFDWSTTEIANIGAAYLIAYAIGQFTASQMATKFGARRNVLVGMALSIGATTAMGIGFDDPWVIGGLFFVNGIAQATGWSGCVGTMATWFHKHERGRVMGVWSTNFTFGSLASAWVLGGVLGMKSIESPWRWCFFVGAMVFTAVLVQFIFLQRNRPEDVGLAPIDDPVTTTDEAKTPEPVGQGWMGLSHNAWRNLFLVGGFYFCAKLVRYAVWSWAAYFMELNYGMTPKESAVYSIVFDVCGLPGVFLTGYLSDKYFGSRRSEVSFFMMLAMTAMTVLLIIFGSASVGVFIVLLGAVGFTLYGPDAILSGAAAVDIGGRNRAAFATGMIATFGALGPIVQELLVGRLYKMPAPGETGSLTPIFVMLFAAAVLGTVFCGLLVLRNRRGGKGI